MSSASKKPSCRRPRPPTSTNLVDRSVWMSDIFVVSVLRAVVGAGEPVGCRLAHPGAAAQVAAGAPKAEPQCSPPEEDQHSMGRVCHDDLRVGLHHLNDMCKTPVCICPLECPPLLHPSLPTLPIGGRPPCAALPCSAKQAMHCLCPQGSCRLIPHCCLLTESARALLMNCTSVAPQPGRMALAVSSQVPVVGSYAMSARSEAR